MLSTSFANTWPHFGMHGRVRPVKIHSHTASCKKSAERFQDTGRSQSKALHALCTILRAQRKTRRRRSSSHPWPPVARTREESQSLCLSLPLSFRGCLTRSRQHQGRRDPAPAEGKGELAPFSLTPAFELEFL